MLTQKDYCDYDTCVALKELGYDELCEGYYHLTDDEDYNQLSFEWCYGRDFQNSLNRWRVGAPMLYEAQKWLREEKGLLIVVDRLLNGEYVFSIVDILNYSEEKNGTANSYEKALSEGVRASIKILQDEQKENN